jgi:transposase
MIDDNVWARLAEILKKCRIHFSQKIRHFIEAILWKFRTGIPWRDLPKYFGPYSSIFNKFNLWSKRGIWKKLNLDLHCDIDNEWNFIDATIVKVHQHASGAAGGRDQAIGKSVAGNTTKVHALVDAYGNPLEFILSGGEVHDSQKAPELIALCEAEVLAADKAYHDKKIRAQAAEKNIQLVIPVKKNSLDQSNPTFDSHIYKLRHLVENFFARIKHFRAIATRYDKTKRNYESGLNLVCAYIWSKI